MRGIGKAAEARQTGQGSRLVGQLLGLLVSDHLQAVLDPAQEHIGLAELGGGASVIQRSLASAASMSSVRRPRSAGLRPPAMSCWVWTKNSISRMPPRPSFRL